MNVYVESGFVLTLALQQDDHPMADQLLRLAIERRITLRLPAFCLSEPFATVHHRANNRHRLIDELRKEIRELRRTQPHGRMAEELAQSATQMGQVLQTQLEALEAVVLRMGEVCDLLPTDAAALARASTIKAVHNLRLPDAIVLATILLDLEREQASAASASNAALFISQNVKDFEAPSVQDALAGLNCKYLADFGNAVRFVTRPAGPGQPT